MKEMKAQEFILKILIDPSKRQNLSKWFKFVRQIENIDGYLIHMFMKPKDVNVADLRKMEVDYEDWFIEAEKKEE